ncbi:M56 family metallopeptidase [Sphingomonas sp. RS2018]
MIAWAVETVIATTLLMVVVLILRRPVRRAFGPAVAYSLWAIPAARMILPPLPAAWQGAAMPTLPVPEDVTIYLGVPITTFAAEPASGIGWPAVMLALWLVGTIGFVAYHIVSHARFCARLRRDADRVIPLASGNVRMIESAAATGPLAFGVLRKYVAFPRDFAERYEPLERDLALAHELGHHARGDLIANWAALVMLGIHWFNPVAWRAYRAFRADQEMACDALVLSGRARDLRIAYGRAIVKSAHGGAVSAACHLHTINEIKGRLKMLGKHEKTSRARLFGGAGALAALAAAGLAVTASGTQASERVRSSVETATGVDLASVELPALPALMQAARVAPPAPPAPVAAAPGTSVDRSDTVTTVDGKSKRHIRVIVRDKDGKVTETTSDDPAFRVALPEGVGLSRMLVIRDKDGKPATFKGGGMPPEALAALRDMPEMSSRDCKDSEGKPNENVINRTDGKKKLIIICTNRIRRTATLAMADAKMAQGRAIFIQRDAEASALAGLRMARRSIEANRDMDAAARTNALNGIDTAMRELESKKD